MRKRIFAFVMAVVVAVGCMSYRPQKAYAFAFAPALIPVAVSLLAACGIFITYTSATDDLESVIDDFLSSDAELGDFVNGIYDQSLVTGSVALNAAQIAFFTDVFIAQAYSYFSKVNSDIDLSGAVWHPVEDFFGMYVPFGATMYFKNSELSFSKASAVLGSGGVWKVVMEFSSDNKITRDAVSGVDYFYLSRGSYYSTGYYQFQYYTVNSQTREKLRFDMGYSTNPNSYMSARVFKIGDVGYCTKGYATTNDLTLKTGYLRDTSVSADAIKASILAADEVYVTPLTDVAGLSTYNNSVVGVYEGGLIGGVVLNPDAVIDPTIPVDPEVPVTGDLTGIAGGIQGILNWLKSWLDKLINALTSLLTTLFVPTTTALEDFVAEAQMRLPSTDNFFGLDLTKIVSDDGKPRWYFTYKGVEYDIFSMALFDYFRTTVHVIIIALAYYRFYRWLLRTIPSVVKGR